MRRRRAAGALVGLLVAAALPATSQAMVVTVGTPLANFGSSSSSYSCGPSCTVAQRAPAATVPADGTITTWRVAGQGTFALTVLRPSPAGLLVVAISGTQATGGTPATVPVSLPVKAGDQIGVDLFGGNPSSRIFLKPDPASVVGIDSPALGSGAGFTGASMTGGDLDLDADVTLAPVAAGTAVTISGSYLDGVTSVAFGGAPAQFTAGAGGVLLAHTPPSGTPGPVDVVVRGPGGASTLTGAFTYTTPAGAGGVNSPAGHGATPGGPVIRKLALAPTSFLAAGVGSTSSAKTGTRINYTLSATATVSFAVARLVAGRIVPARGGQGRYCQPALLPVPAAARCTKSIALTPHITQRAGFGANALRFTGRLGGRALTPGSYRFTATAVDASGGRSAAVTHAFRVLAPPARSCPQAHGSASSGGC
jgi:hypothetical protein